MGDNPAVKQFINNEIENIIKDIKKEIKENKDLINSSGEIFILE